MAAPSTAATVITTALSTATYPVTTIPMFLSTEVPVASFLATLPHDVAVGAISSAKIDFLGSVVAADSEAVTYELDCTTSSRAALFKPTSSFECPYSGAMITSGPSTFAFQQPGRDLSMSCSSVSTSMPTGCTISAAASSSRSTGGITLYQVPLIVTAGAEKLHANSESSQSDASIKSTTSTAPGATSAPASAGPGQKTASNAASRRWPAAKASHGIALIMVAYVALACLACHVLGALVS